MAIVIVGLGTTGAILRLSAPQSVVVGEFSFKMTIPRDLGAFSYSVDHRNDGDASTDNQTSTIVGMVLLTTPNFAPAKCANEIAEAAILVEATSANERYESGGPTEWRRVGPYLLGWFPDSLLPTTRGQCSWARDRLLFHQMFQSANPI